MTCSINGTITINLNKTIKTRFVKFLKKILVVFALAILETLYFKTPLIIKYLDELWNMVGLQNIPDSSEDIQ